MLAWLRRWRAARAVRAGAVPDGGAAAATGAGRTIVEDADADEAAGAGAGSPALADELDLHTFLPGECADVVSEYVRAAQEAGLPSVRIVHGKGRGTLRRTVHAVLARHPAVRGYRLAEPHRGGWGATLVEIAPPAPAVPAPGDR